MLSLGVLSLLQIWVLPGFALLCWLPYRLRVTQAMVLTGLASLTINFALVWALILIGIYDRSVLLAVVAVETAIILAALLRKPGDRANNVGSTRESAMGLRPRPPSSTFPNRSLATWSPDPGLKGS